MHLICFRTSACCARNVDPPHMSVSMMMMKGHVMVNNTKIQMLKHNNIALQFVCEIPNSQNNDMMRQRLPV